MTIVGYSLGALIARKAFLYGCNQVDDVPHYNRANPPLDWVSLVDRFVLLAGANCGWSIDLKAA